MPTPVTSRIELSPDSLRKLSTGLPTNPAGIAQAQQIINWAADFLENAAHRHEAYEGTIGELNAANETVARKLLEIIELKGELQEMKNNKEEFSKALSTHNQQGRKPLGLKK
jgi:hypothetical protein